MALIVEDGTGLSTAESYISVTDATTYIDAYSLDTLATAWTAATTAAKEKALRQATRWLEANYGGNRLTGSKATQTQALSWPRIGAIDPDDFTVPSSTVPTPFKHAAAELAARALSTDIMADLTTPGTIRSQRDKVGDLETETTYAGAASQIPYYRVIAGMLRGWAYSYTELERG